MYREHGKAGYDLPTIRARELDVILAEQFQKLVKRQRQIIRLVIDSITDTQQREDHSDKIARLEAQIQQLEDKKDKLLELSVADAITMQEFKKRSNRFNEQIILLQAQVISLQQRERYKQSTANRHGSAGKGAVGGSELRRIDPIGNGGYDSRPRCGMRGQQ